MLLFQYRTEKCNSIICYHEGSGCARQIPASDTFAYSYTTAKMVLHYVQLVVGGTKGTAGENAPTSLYVKKIPWYILDSFSDPRGMLG